MTGRDVLRLAAFFAAGGLGSRVYYTLRARWCGECARPFGIFGRKAWMRVGMFGDRRCWRCWRRRYRMRVRS